MSVEQQIEETVETVEQGIIEGLKVIGCKTPLSPAAQAHLEAAMESLRAVMAECLAPEATPVTGTNEPEQQESRAAAAKRIFGKLICPTLIS